MNNQDSKIIQCKQPGQTKQTHKSKALAHNSHRKKGNRERDKDNMHTMQKEREEAESVD